MFFQINSITQKQEIPKNDKMYIKKINFNNIRCFSNIDYKDFIFIFSFNFVIIALCINFNFNTFSINI